MFKKEEVMTVEEFLQMEKVKEIETYLSKNKNMEKVFVFMLGSLMYCQNVMACNADLSKVNKAGNVILNIVQTFGYWACIVLCIIDLLKHLFDGNTKNIGKIVSGYVVAFSAFYFIPWIFDIIKSIFK
ncbi:hypothetical protein HAHI6034_11770 [Hathewaya histolytica]|uniref:Uncharacterized protein n=1 Tax=Hathewaya histolytica TaxID=1498 RepID=A0A4U9REV7_HATHI|nr:hypothetical protein [Hathewaya histolytica]VTQ88903.1 Uncharacterised protein [Hathewaya histolytica]